MSRQRCSVSALIVGAFCTALAQAQVPANAYDYTRTSSFEYNATTGFLTAEIVEPDNLASCVKTTYGLDAYGNRRTTSVANCPGTIPGRAPFTNRSSTTEFAPATPPTVIINGISVVLTQGAFPITVTNALSQSESKTFDPRFGAVLSVTGPNALTTRWQHDDFGRKVKETRADGTSTVWAYCYISGRVPGNDVSSNSGAGQPLTCPAPGGLEIPADAVQFVHSEPRNTSGTKMGAFTRSYVDRLGRTIRNVTEAFDGAAQPAAPGTTVAQDVAYNIYGAKEIETQPYFLASRSSTTTGSVDHGVSRTVYDVLGRPTTVYVADAAGTQTSVAFGTYGSRRASRTTVSYNGLTSTTTNDKGQTQVQEKNPNGKVVRVTDALGAQLVHQYDAFDNLVKTKDALNNTTTLIFDLRGRKTQLNDPNAGQTQYDYNALGELVWQQNAKQRAAIPVQQTTMVYDVLSRVTSRTEPEYITTWTYDKYANLSACAKGAGKLCEVSTTNGVNRKLVYDSLGRLINARTSVTSGPSFASAVAYDPSTGRPFSQTYPTGLKVNTTYTTKGFLEKLTLATAATVNPLPSTPGGTPGASATIPVNTVLWQAKVVNAWGRLEQSSTHNGVNSRAVYEAATGRVSAITAGPNTTNTVLNYSYSWDSLSNLASRSDAIGDGSGAVTESFAHDALNRLTQYDVSSPAIVGLTRRVTLKYNALGSLLYKSDVGAFTYNASGPTSVRPHALASVNSATVTSLTHDGNGNVITASAGKYTSLAYTSFNLPDASSGILGGTGNNTRTTWLYDENHARLKETRTITGGVMAGTRTTWALHPDQTNGLAFESEVNAPTAPSAQNPLVTSNRHYLSAGGMAVGVLISTGALPTLAAGATVPPTLASVTLVKVEYWHKDHLGSTAATTNHAGAVTGRYAYDPFGKRRSANGVYDFNGTLLIDYSPAINNGADRGFTGHEHLDELGLIHMNGRLFDPRLGIFLQADPLIQDALNLQSYNRYIYCVSGPMGCTDPSGYGWLRDIFKWTDPLHYWTHHYIHRHTQGLRHNQYVRIAGAIVASYFLGPGGYFGVLGATGNAVASAAVAGFAAGAITSGSFKGGVQGAFFAVAFYGVGQVFGDFNLAGIEKNPEMFAGAVAAHGIVGCVQSVVGGGKCGPGLLSAAFSKMASPATGQLGKGWEGRIGGAVISAVIGGTAAELGGGNFANGAKTAAFSYLFNDMAHEMSRDGSFRSDGDTAYPTTREEWIEHTRRFGAGAVITVGISVGGPLAIAAGLDASAAVAWVGYIGVDGLAVVRYVGITSRDAAVRWAEHMAADPAKAALSWEVSKGFSTQLGARVWEQVQINSHVLMRHGGTLLNRINSIAPKYWDKLGIK